MAMDPGIRVDELARRAGVATTTVRLYQAKGLLPPPRLVGRTGYYDDAHLTRLEVIGRLQDQGFSLAGIGTLLESWERGGDLGDLVGAEAELGGLLGTREQVVLDAEGLLAAFPPDSLDPSVVSRAAALGLVEATDDGRFRVRDVRFLETGTELARLGVPAHTILDEWEHLASVTDQIAERFATVFEEHLLPDDWRDGLEPGEAARLASTLATLRVAGERVLVAALDESIAKMAAARFGELLENEPSEESMPGTPLPTTSNPAQRALEAEGITTLEELSRHREQDLLALHGVGPKAIRILREALAERGLSFRD
jgi:DNA-binding transcriptional MerR regulator